MSDNSTTLQAGNRTQEAIAVRAYQLWEARGCPAGSPEEDWYRAEQELRGQSLRLKAQVWARSRGTVYEVKGL